MKKALNNILNFMSDLPLVICVIAGVILLVIYYSLEKPLKNIAYCCLLPFAGIAYLLFDNYKSIKRKRHRHNLHKQGRVTEHNPYADRLN